MAIEDRLTPRLRRRVLALPLGDRLALQKDLARSLQESTECQGFCRMETLRGKMQEVSGVDIHERTRLHNYVEARVVFAAVCRLEGFSQVEIAQYLGRDHSTICHGEKIFSNALAYPKTYPSLIELYNNFTNAIL